METKSILARHQSNSNEWFTPPQYIEAARRTMGSIDLDPASCAQANEIVKATQFYSEADNGLKQPWRGNVWLNPPYGKIGNVSNQEVWSKRLIALYDAGKVEQAILLTSAVDDTEWSQRLMQYPHCSTRGRIRFNSPQGASSQPTLGSVFYYFGDHINDFYDNFARFGIIRMALSKRELFSLLFEVGK